ncbi:glycine zipper 2TM domain-containing protein [Qipengyuania sp. ASV99]|uniref:glycine zipper 2TM domain-containing protein n=1 Tax=Qipengyuania sp. ASV99 TaxID=3399681 RepID=UPI003A4C6ADD
MMKLTAMPRRTVTAAGVAFAALALPNTAQAQDREPMSQAEVQSLPSQYRTGPSVQDFSETVVGPDGAETIVRTRQIESIANYPGGPSHGGAHSGPYPQGYGYSRHGGYAAAGYAPAGSVFERDQWIAECERRTNGRGDSEKGGIIGGLLGAIAGGIIGNRVSDGERLGGTLIGAGVGGLGGLLIGSLIGGGRDDRGDYDCEAALDSYLSQYGYNGYHGAHGTVHSITAHGYPAYAHHGQQQYGYSYAPPQQIVYVPVQVQQHQRVIVRETVREEIVPGAVREIPRPALRPAAPRYIKGD